MLFLRTGHPAVQVILGLGTNLYLAIPIALLLLPQAVRGSLFPGTHDQTFVLVGVAGAVGSIVSMLVRIKDFDNEQAEHRAILFFTGFFKPVIGIASALFMAMILEAGLIPLGIANTDQRMFFYLALAFVAGFSERLASDIVTQAEAKVLSRGGTGLQAQGVRLHKERGMIQTLIDARCRATPRGAGGAGAGPRKRQVLAGPADRSRPPTPSRGSCSRRGRCGSHSRPARGPPARRGRRAPPSGCGSNPRAWARTRSPTSPLQGSVLARLVLSEDTLAERRAAARGGGGSPRDRRPDGRPSPCGPGSARASPRTSRPPPARRSRHAPDTPSRWTRRPSSPPSSSRRWASRRRGKRTKSGYYSTASAVLEALAPRHPIAALVLEYRALQFAPRPRCCGSTTPSRGIFTMREFEQALLVDVFDADARRHGAARLAGGGGAAHLAGGAACGGGGRVRHPAAPSPPRTG